MSVLFLDTHSEKITEIIKTEKNIFIKEALSQLSHSEIAMPLLEELFATAGLEPNEIDEIIVVNGPGSFTGVRIGVTIAKTIAFSFNIPIKTITSLEMYGVSSNKKFDLVGVEDAKGVYSAKLRNGKYEDFIYQKKSIYKKMIEEEQLTVLKDKKIDINKIIEYMSTKDNINPHLVNPIYIKEIDALK